MSNWFKDCRTLTSINFYKSAYEVIDMRGMFSGCEKLEYLDLSSFNTQYIDSMDSIFENCENLIQIRINPIFFTTREVITMNDMFRGCKKLKSFDFSGFDTSKFENMVECFHHALNLMN